VENRRFWSRTVWVGEIDGNSCLDREGGVLGQFLARSHVNERRRFAGSRVIVEASAILIATTPYPARARPFLVGLMVP